MVMRMSQILYLLLTVGVISAYGRARRGQMSKRVPIYRSLDVQTLDDEEDAIPKKSKLTLVKGRGNEASEGRLFKHLLLLKQLSGTGSGGGGGNASGTGLVPYIIVNNPSQLTNVNTNVIPGAPPATTTTTGTGTGTGTGGGGGGGRIGVAYLSDSEALPQPMRIPTPIYQQRHQAFPQVIYGPPLKSVTKTVRRGNLRRKKNNVRQNPFSAFANNLKRIQFL